MLQNVNSCGEVFFNTQSESDIVEWLFLPSLHDYDVKMPKFTMYRGSTEATTKFPLSFWSWIWFLGIQLQEGSPTFDKVSDLELSRWRLKEREFTFSATFSLPSPSSDLKVPNVTFSQAFLFRLFQKVSQRHPKVFKRNESKLFQKDRLNKSLKVTNATSVAISNDDSHYFSFSGLPLITQPELLD